MESLKGSTGLPVLQPLTCLPKSRVDGEWHDGKGYQYAWSIGFPVLLSCCSLVAFESLNIKALLEGNAEIENVWIF